MRRGLVLSLVSVACAAAPASTAQQPPAATQEEAEDTSTASQAPDTEIHLADLQLGDTASISNLRNATAREGYDNQPFFVDGRSEFFYTSIRDGQADIYAFDVGSGESRVVHHDPANEYSPTVMPGGKGISMIREAGGVQKLWHYSPTGEDLGSVLEDVVDVGYHAWLSAEDVALFVLDVEGGRHKLEIVHVPDQSRKPVAENIGRCMSIYPRSIEPTGAISFVALSEDEGGESSIMRYDLKSGEATELLKTRPGSQDYAWAPDGSLLMVQGTMLHRWTEAKGWAEVSDLGFDASLEVTRLAISGDGKMLAIVTGPKPEE